MLTIPFVRSAYNYDRDQVSDDTGLMCLDPTLTKQEFAEEVDINTIIRRFNVGGDLPQNVRAPTYGDFTGIDSFQEAVQAIALANEAFDEMPAAVRARFHNNPEEFVAFCSDANNLEDMRKMGLTDPRIVRDNPVAGNVASVNRSNENGDSTSVESSVGADGKGVVA